MLASSSGNNQGSALAAGRQACPSAAAVLVVATTQAGYARGCDVSVVTRGFAGIHTIGRDPCLPSSTSALVTDCLRYSGQATGNPRTASQSVLAATSGAFSAADVDRASQPISRYATGG